MWKWIKWFIKGKPTKKIIGGWCGCCGKWVNDKEFIFPDFWIVDKFFNRNTICYSCKRK